MTERYLGDYDSYMRALKPVACATVVSIRNQRTNRPVKTRGKDAEELRMLLRASRMRRRQYAERGLLVQTGPREWIMRIDEPAKQPGTLGEDEERCRRNLDKTLGLIDACFTLKEAWLKQQHPGLSESEIRRRIYRGIVARKERQWTSQQR